MQKVEKYQAGAGPQHSQGAAGGWIKASTFVAVSGMSRDTVKRRSAPWQEEYVPRRIRFKLLKLDAFAEPLPRYYLPDVQAFLHTPPMRGALEFQPIFKSNFVRSAYHQATDEETEEELVVTSVTWRIARAAKYLDLSRDAIEARMIEWQDTHVPYRLRTSQTQLKIGCNHVRVIYSADVEALLITSVINTHQTKPTKFHHTSNSRFCTQSSKSATNHNA